MIDMSVGLINLEDEDYQHLLCLKNYIELFGRQLC